MGVDILELLRKDPATRLLADYGVKQGITYKCYISMGGWAWYFLPPSNSIAIPFDKKLQTILPLGSNNRKFRLAHELGHAKDYPGFCPNVECEVNRGEKDSCFFEERRAWVNGVKILEEVCHITPDEKKEYLAFAFRIIKEQTSRCIRFLVADPSKISEEVSGE